MIFSKFLSCGYIWVNCFSVNENSKSNNSISIKLTKIIFLSNFSLAFYNKNCIKLIKLIFVDENPFFDKYMILPAIYVNITSKWNPYLFLVAFNRLLKPVIVKYSWEIKSLSHFGSYHSLRKKMDTSPFYV